MSNKVILWSMIIVPWLSLFFLRKEDLKRFVPAGLIAIISTILILDMGVALNWWIVKENVFPLNEILPLTFGFFFAADIWILKYTYGRFWMYTLVQISLGFVFVFFVQPWFSLRGIWIRVNATNFLAFLPVIPNFLVIYLFQMWYENELDLSFKKIILPVLGPFSNKPHFKNNDDKSGD
ncbi:MAG: hypothetical protein ABRQ26_12215 [Syntrophomonadaceae bacterium]